MRRIKTRWAVAAACALTLVVAGTASAGASPGRIVLPGTSVKDGLVDKGPLPVDTPVSQTVYLAVKDPEGLARRAKAVSDPDSADYGRFLGPDRIRETTQLDREQVDKVRDWLTGTGLSVTAPDWRHLRVTGTAGQLNKAFAVTFHDYVYPPESGFKGHYLVPSPELSVPAELGSLVLGVGQETIVVRDAGKTAPKKSAERRSDTETAAAAECSKHWGQLPAKDVPKVNGATPPVKPCGYTPKQLRHAYGLDGLDVTGAGQTVAVVSTPSDTLEQDINTWADRVGTQRLRPGQLTTVPTPDGSPKEDPLNGFPGMIESTMDAEAVHAIAPDANIVAIGQSTAQGGNLLASMSYALDRTDASIISLSLASDPTPGMRKAFDQVFQEGALQGVGFYFCTGDGGVQPSDSGGDWLNSYAGSDWVTAVGGTSLAIGPKGERLWETGWGTPVSMLSQDGKSWEEMLADGGTGGGRADGRPQPWYQQGVVPDRYATTPDGKRGRVGPDVAMTGDAVTGMLAGGVPMGASPTTDPSTWRYAERTVGGTSLSTPLFAGVQALAQQAHGKRIGFANPVLYKRAGTPAFRDVTPYRLPNGDPATAVVYRSNPDGGKTPELYHFLATQMPGGPADGFRPPEVAPGFDTETGLGTPTGEYLRSIGGY